LTLCHASPRLPPSSLTAVHVQPSYPSFLQYTGGTTGVSKGACLTHRSVLASVLQMQSWLRLALDLENCELITPVPLYHVYPLGMALMALACGAPNRLDLDQRDTKTQCHELQGDLYEMLIRRHTLRTAME